MLTFQINDMTCGRCASAISRAVAAVDKDARLDIRIQEKLVRVTSSASAAELAEAIRDAGYTPREVQAKPAQAPRARAASGCGCGCGSRKPAAVEVAQGAAAPGGSCCS